MAIDVTGFECWIFVLVFLFIIFILAILAYLLKRIKGKKTSTHYCRYCGHLNPVVSDCCGGKVEEGFAKGKFSVCGQECRIVCSKCRRPIH